MTWYQSSSPLLHLEYGYPNLFYKNGPSRNSYGGSREQREDKGLCRRKLLAFQLTHNSDVHDWESGPASHPDEEQGNASIVHLIPCYHPSVSIRILRASLSWMSGSWWWDSFYEEISQHCFRASFPSFYCDLVNKASPRLLNTTLSNKFLIPNLVALFLFPIEFIIF